MCVFACVFNEIYTSFQAELFLSVTLREAITPQTDFYHLVTWKGLDLLP